MSTDGRAQELRLSEKDITAFNEFYEGNLTQLMAAVRRLGAGQQQAMNVAQHAMVLLLRHFPTVGRSEGERYSYVKLIAIRHYYGGLAEAEKERKAIADADWIRPSRSTDDVDGERRIIQLLERLSPKQQAVVALFVDGYTPSETAALLGQPAATVSSNLRHGLTKLRIYLEQLQSQQDQAGDQEGG